MRILAIDYGRRRIGLAISDPEGKIATPLTTLILDDLSRLLNEIKTIIREEDVKKVIIGNPVRDDGKSSELADEISGFSKRLADETGLDIELVDEYYSSKLAEKKFHETGRKIKSNKNKIDRLAAARMLQEYLDTGRNR
jgi:putative Holliday junction resolvase